MSSLLYIMAILSGLAFLLRNVAGKDALRGVRIKSSLHKQPRLPGNRGRRFGDQ